MSRELEAARVVTNRDGTVGVEVGRRVEPVVERHEISWPTLRRILRAQRDREPLVMNLGEPRFGWLWVLAIVAGFVIGKGCV